MFDQEKKETLSAFVDGELEEHAARKLLDDESGSAELRETWARYHLIGDVIGQRLPDTYGQAFLKRLELARESESPPVAIPISRRRPFVSRPALGFALAASVAVLAILGIRQFGDSVSPQPTVVASTAISGPKLVKQARMRWNVQQPAVEARLNSYLVNHSEYLDHGMSGRLPYARIVGYDAGK
jgi:sigma-E factor negative regulatory protein RseA